MRIGDIEEKMKSFKPADDVEEKSEAPPSNRTLQMDIKCEELENRMVEQIDNISTRLLKLQTAVKIVELMQKSN